jgi:hypothetical protein
MTSEITFSLKNYFFYYKKAAGRGRQIAPNYHFPWNYDDIG